MISQEKRKILTPLQKLPYNVGDLGKIIGATSFEWLPKVQKIAQSGLAAYEAKFHHKEAICLFLSFKMEVYDSTNLLDASMILQSKLALAN